MQVLPNFIGTPPTALHLRLVQSWGALRRVSHDPLPRRFGCLFNRRWVNDCSPRCRAPRSTTAKVLGDAWRACSLRCLPALEVRHGIAVHFSRGGFRPVVFCVQGRLRDERQHDRKIIGIRGRRKFREHRVRALSGRLGESQKKDEETVITRVDIGGQLAAESRERFHRTFTDLGLVTVIEERKRGV